MSMKKVYYIVSFVGLLAFHGCSLKEDTSSLSVPGNFFRSFSECQSVVNSCYIPAKSIYSQTYYTVTECQSDIAYINYGTLDCRLDVTPTLPRFASTVWNNGYLGVQRCNFAIPGIEQATSITEDQRIQMICEAKVLRAFYYYTLTCFFGNVPFYFDDVSDFEVMDRIAQLPRMSAVETRKACIEDLLSIASDAPQTRTSDNVGARVGASAAWLLIGKMALWNAFKDVPANKEKWLDTAISALEKLEPIYGNLADYDYAYNTWFRNKNTPESIMEIQHLYVRGGVSYVSNLAAYMQPNSGSTYVSQAIFDGVFIPELGYDSDIHTSARPTKYFSQGLQPRRGRDIRKDSNMAWEYGGQQFASVNSNPWPGPKFWCPDMVKSNDGNNYKVFRYADALLMLSEAWFEKGDNGKALEYLNRVRRRAGLNDYVYRTDVRLRDEIRAERARELFGEFQRKYDLVRWGIWYDAVYDNSDFETLRENMLPCHEYYPIPETEVTKSKYNLDNNAYKQYGL